MEEELENLEGSSLSEIDVSLDRFSEDSDFANTHVNHDFYINDLLFYVPPEGIFVVEDNKYIASESMRSSNSDKIPVGIANETFKVEFTIPNKFAIRNIDTRDDGLEDTNTGKRGGYIDLILQFKNFPFACIENAFLRTKLKIPIDHNMVFCVHNLTIGTSPTEPDTLIGEMVFTHMSYAPYSDNWHFKKYWLSKTGQHFDSVNPVKSMPGRTPYLSEFKVAAMLKEADTSFAVGENYMFGLHKSLYSTEKASGYVWANENYMVDPTYQSVDAINSLDLQFMLPSERVQFPRQSEPFKAYADWLWDNHTRKIINNSFETFDCTQAAPYGSDSQDLDNQVVLKWKEFRNIQVPPVVADKIREGISIQLKNFKLKLFKNSPAIDAFLTEAERSALKAWQDEDNASSGGSGAAVTPEGKINFFGNGVFPRNSSMFGQIRPGNQFKGSDPFLRDVIVNRSTASNEAQKTLGSDGRLFRTAGFRFHNGIDIFPADTHPDNIFPIFTPFRLKVMESTTHDDSDMEAGLGTVVRGGAARQRTVILDASNMSTSQNQNNASPNLAAGLKSLNKRFLKLFESKGIDLEPRPDGGFKKTLKLGVDRFTTHDIAGGSGKRIVAQILDGPFAGHYFFFFHMSTFKAALEPVAGKVEWHDLEFKPGTIFEAGECIGFMGGTSVETPPPHLHIELSKTYQFMTTETRLDIGNLLFQGNSNAPVNVLNAYYLSKNMKGNYDTYNKNTVTNLSKKGEDKFIRNAVRYAVASKGTPEWKTPEDLLNNQEKILRERGQGNNQAWDYYKLLILRLELEGFYLYEDDLTNFDLFYKEHSFSIQSAQDVEKELNGEYPEEPILCTYINGTCSNSYKTLPVQGIMAPTAQFVGANDDQFILDIECVGLNTIKKLELIRDTLKKQGLTFKNVPESYCLRVENKFINGFGNVYFIINNLEIANKKEAPGVHARKLTLTSNNLYQRVTNLIRNKGASDGEIKEQFLGELFGPQEDLSTSMDMEPSPEDNQIIDKYQEERAKMGAPVFKWKTHDLEGGHLHSLEIEIDPKAKGSKYTQYYVTEGNKFLQEIAATINLVSRLLPREIYLEKGEPPRILTTTNKYLYRAASGFKIRKPDKGIYKKFGTYIRALKPQDEPYYSSQIMQYDPDNKTHAALTMTKYSSDYAKWAATQDWTLGIHDSPGLGAGGEAGAPPAWDWTLERNPVTYDLKDDVVRFFSFSSPSLDSSKDVYDGALLEWKKNNEALNAVLGTTKDSNNISVAPWPAYLRAHRKFNAVARNTLTLNSYLTLVNMRWDPNYSETFAEIKQTWSAYSGVAWTAAKVAAMHAALTIIFPPGGILAKGNLLMRGGYHTGRFLLGKASKIIAGTAGVVEAVNQSEDVGVIDYFWKIHPHDQGNKSWFLESKQDDIDFVHRLNYENERYDLEDGGSVAYAAIDSFASERIILSAQEQNARSQAILSAMYAVRGGSGLMTRYLSGNFAIYGRIFDLPSHNTPVVATGRSIFPRAGAGATDEYVPPNLQKNLMTPYEKTDHPWSYLVGTFEDLQYSLVDQDFIDYLWEYLITPYLINVLRISEIQKLARNTDWFPKTRSLIISKEQENIPPTYGDLNLPFHPYWNQRNPDGSVNNITRGSSFTEPNFFLVNPATDVAEAEQSAPSMTTVTNNNEAAEEGAGNAITPSELRSLTVDVAVEKSIGELYGLAAVDTDPRRIYKGSQAFANSISRRSENNLTIEAITQGATPEIRAAEIKRLEEERRNLQFDGLDTLNACVQQSTKNNSRQNGTTGTNDATGAPDEVPTVSEQKVSWNEISMQFGDNVDLLGSFGAGVVPRNSLFANPLLNYTYQQYDALGTEFYLARVRSSFSLRQFQNDTDNPKDDPQYADKKKEFDDKIKTLVKDGQMNFCLPEVGQATTGSPIETTRKDDATYTAGLQGAVSTFGNTNPEEIKIFDYFDMDSENAPPLGLSSNYWNMATKRTPLKVKVKEALMSMGKKKLSAQRAYPVAVAMFYDEDDLYKKNYIAHDECYRYDHIDMVEISDSRKRPASVCQVTFNDANGILSGFNQFNKAASITGKGTVIDQAESDSPYLADTQHEQSDYGFVLSPGIKMKILMGYSNDVNKLEEVFLGEITNVELDGSSQKVVVEAQSYGAELVADLKGSKRVYGAESKPIRYLDTFSTLSNLMFSPEVIHFGRRKFDDIVMFTQDQSLEKWAVNFKETTNIGGMYNSGRRGGALGAVGAAGDLGGAADGIGLTIGDFFSKAQRQRSMAPKAGPQDDNLFAPNFNATQIITGVDNWKRYYEAFWKGEFKWTNDQSLIKVQPVDNSKRNKSKNFTAEVTRLRMEIFDLTTFLNEVHSAGAKTEARRQMQEKVAELEILERNQQLNTGSDGFWLEAFTMEDLQYAPYYSTIWDVCQEMTYRHPGYVKHPRIFYKSNRMTMFFGMPDQNMWESEGDPSDVFKANKLFIDLATSSEIINAEGKAVNATPEMKTLEEWANDSGQSLQGLRANPNLEGAGGSISNTVFGALKTFNAQGAQLVVNSEKLNIFLKFAKRRFRPFRRWHYVNSYSDIASNSIEASGEGWFTEINVQFGGANYNAEDAYKSSEAGAADPNVFVKWNDANIVTKRANIDLSPAFIRSQHYSFINVRSRGMAKRYARAILAEQAKEMYKGSLIIYGNPYMRPYDIIMLNDTYNEMYGPIEIEEVHQMYNKQTGWVTQIFPDTLVVSDDVTPYVIHFGVNNQTFLKTELYAGNASNMRPLTPNMDSYLANSFLAERLQRIYNDYDQGIEALSKDLKEINRLWSDEGASESDKENSGELDMLSGMSDLRSMAKWSSYGLAGLGYIGTMIGTSAASALPLVGGIFRSAKINTTFALFGAAYVGLSAYFYAGSMFQSFVMNYLGESRAYFMIPLIKNGEAFIAGINIGPSNGVYKTAFDYIRQYWMDGGLGLSAKETALVMEHQDIRDRYGKDLSIVLDYEMKWTEFWLGWDHGFLNFGDEMLKVTGLAAKMNANNQVKVPGTQVPVDSLILQGSRYSTKQKF